MPDRASHGRSVALNRCFRGEDRQDRATCPRAAARNSMWWSYYAFWLLVPTVLAVVSAHPVVLVVVVVALVARRWLPDPFMYLRHAGRVHSLRQQVEINQANATARAQLAEIWLAKRRP